MIPRGRPIGAVVALVWVGLLIVRSAPTNILAVLSIVYASAVGVEHCIVRGVRASVLAVMICGGPPAVCGKLCIARSSLVLAWAAHLIVRSSSSTVLVVILTI